MEWSQWNCYKKCNTYIYILSRFKLYISTENRKRLHNAYILPHFGLCCVIWGNCTHYMEEKLVRLQKSAARVILDCDFDTPSSTMFSDLKWMSFPERVIYIWKPFKCLKLLREMRLNTLDRPLLLRLICMQYCYVHRLISI